jgi:hypothetical protein
MANPINLSDKTTTVFVLLLLLVPMLVYLFISSYYPLNIPFIDDFSSILERVNSAAEATTYKEMMAALFAPNAGHTPFLTRAILLVEGLYLGGINFKYSLIAGNIGLILASIALVAYCRKKHHTPLYLLIPIPFLLLSITHWEQMDFLTPAWQMSWGSVLLPILCFIAITEKRAITAGVLFAGAVYFSAGGFVLYPMALLYCLLKKHWRSFILFTVTGAILTLPLWYFSFFTNGEKHPLDIVKIIYYFPAFMGNIISTGQYDLTPYVALHRTIGLAIVFAGGYAFYKFKGYDVEKMLFVYTVILGILAAFVRGTTIDNVPPRYSLFAMLALICMGVMFTNEWLKHKSLNIYKVSIITMLAIFLWAHSLYQCIKLLEFNKNYRSGVVKQYLSGNTQALEGLLWKVEYAEKELSRAKKNGFYDIEVMREK